MFEDELPEQRSKLLVARTKAAGQQKEPVGQADQDPAALSQFAHEMRSDLGQEDPRRIVPLARVR